MPTRSSTSSVLVWPDRGAVVEAARAWAGAIARDESRVRRVGYFGSYARNDWGVGSDLDLIIVLADSDLPWERRAAAWDTTPLPVPADLLVYTEREWDQIDPESRFGRMIRRETRWLVTA